MGRERGLMELLSNLLKFPGSSASVWSQRLFMWPYNMTKGRLVFILGSCVLTERLETICCYRDRLVPENMTHLCNSLCSYMFFASLNQTIYLIHYYFWRQNGHFNQIFCGSVRFWAMSRTAHSSPTVLLSSLVFRCLVLSLSCFWQPQHVFLRLGIIFIFKIL